MLYLVDILNKTLITNFILNLSSFKGIWDCLFMHPFLINTGVKYEK